MLTRRPTNVFVRTGSLRARAAHSPLGRAWGTGVDLARDVFAVWTRPVPPSERLHDTPPAIRVRSALAFVGALLAAVVLAGAASWGAALRMGAGT